MDLGLDIAAQGMLTEQVRQDQLANDLANASTPGYKPTTAVQRSFNELLQLSNTQTGQYVGPMGTGVGIAGFTVDLSQGSLQHTGQPLDFAVEGDGFFAVRTGQGVRYTRDGQFTSNAQGFLTDSQGNPVLSQAGQPITVPANGQLPTSALGLFGLTNVTKQGYNLYNGTVTGRGTGAIQQGSLEQSNADPVRTMVEMISSLRSYESGQKAIQSIDETLQDAAGKVATQGGS